MSGPPVGYCLYVAGDRAEADYLSWTSTVNNLSLVHPLLMDIKMALREILPPAS